MNGNEGNENKVSTRVEPRPMNTDYEQRGEGAFTSSLKRNNAKIRSDRAIAIAEDTELVYGRSVQDLEISLKRLRRERENMLDLSPTNSTNLVLASDFDPNDYVTKDIELGVKIRNTEIKLEIAKERYSYLFGGK